MAKGVSRQAVTAVVVLIVVLIIAAPRIYPSGFAVAGSQNDLTVKSVWFPESVRANTYFNAKVTVSNSGNGPTMTFIKYRFEIYSQNSQLKFSKDVLITKIGSGDTTDVLDHVEVNEPGSYVVKVDMDYDKAYDESDESNNLYVDTLTVT